MAISVTCSECGATHNVPDDRAGQVGRCPCGATMAVPATAAPDDSSMLLDDEPSAPPAVAPPSVGGPPIAAPPQGVAPPAPRMTTRAGGGEIPTVVRVARLLNFIAVFLALLAALFWVMCIFAVKRGQPAGEIAMVAFGGLVVMAFGLFLGWVGKSLGEANSLAWRLQMGLSVMGVGGFPVGTIVGVYVLVNWFKPEIKAWFGV